MNRIPPILRGTLIASSGFLLLHAVTYGPGMGITLIPNDEPWSAAAVLIRGLAYALFLLGAIASKKHLRMAILLLATGLICRGCLEIFISAIKYSFQGITLQKVSTDLAGFLKEVCLLAVFYWFSFILPALLLLDCIRLRRLGPPRQSSAEGAD